jgi:hypothetical protein
MSRISKTKMKAKRKPMKKSAILGHAARKQRKSHEGPELMALAYSDAVRDILGDDGRFCLADGERRDAVWEWDGSGWRRVPLVDRPVERANDDAFEDAETDEDLAVAS